MGVLTGISLFSGAGGLDLAAKRAGIRTVCYVEYDPYAQAVLMSRMRDGGLDEAPIWDDVRSFRATDWSGGVDCIFGGFPCQDLSIAGEGVTGRKGIVDGTRSGLWLEFSRIIREVRPRFVVVENVTGLLDGWLGIVLGDLAIHGYDAEWRVLSACQFGAPHSRERVFILAYPNGLGRDELEENKKNISTGVHSEMPGPWGNNQNYLRIPVAWSGAEPRAGVLRVDDGMAEELDRIRLCGNGVVPQQAYPIFAKIVAMTAHRGEG